ncbi:solute carrier family 15 member 4-like [Argonauta hians]
METNGNSYGSTEVAVRHDIQLLADSEDPSRIEPKIINSNETNDKLSGKAWGRVKKFFTMKSKFPSSIYHIVGNEVCERFSFYGMKAILTLYLTRHLLIEANTATAIFHAFNFLCYASPIAGAMIADGMLGKYKTILYISIIYCVGNIVMSLTAIPPAETAGPMIGLILIAMGTGGIKPCVAAFGGDQFNKGEEKLVQTFFSIFYFMINVGSLLSTLLSPLIRANVTCFGEDCYLLAFGIPAILMVIAILLFIAGTNKYKKLPPTGDLLSKVSGCIWYSIKQYFVLGRTNSRHPHWLDAGLDKYDPQFVEDVKIVLRVLLMFIPLPLFWALFDQQGSRWTLQAEKMDGSLDYFGTIQPDQMQAINPILIILLIPLLETVIYPLLDYFNVPNRPLQRMVIGMAFATASFMVAGFLELHINNMAINLSPEESGLTVVNVAPCEVSVESVYFTGKLPYLQESDFDKHEPGTHFLNYSSSCTSNDTSELTIKLNKGEAKQIFLYEINNKINAIDIPEQKTVDRKKNAGVTVLNLLPLSYGSQIKLQMEDSYIILNNTQPYTTSSKNVDAGTYTIYRRINNVWVESPHKVKFLQSDTYTVTLVSDGDQDKFDVQLHRGLLRHSVSILQQIPQYILLTIGEVMFSVTGISFAYSQSPASMKSVLQAAWLLTVAGGNVIVVFVAEVRIVKEQSSEFFLFACLMAVDVIIYAIMSMFYRYADPLNRKSNSSVNKLNDTQENNAEE